jgi:CheY-like chemotaxis protein
MVMESRKQIGSLLVDAGIISVKTLERALEMQKGSGKRLGTLLRDMGIVTEEEVVEALASQCRLKTVRNFADHPFPRELLDLVTAQMALDKMIFPLKRHDGTLAIAVLDPLDRETFAQLAQRTGMRIYLALSTREDIIAAIEKHYLDGERVKAFRQKILLIDDSPVFTQVLETALGKEGYEVLVAGDGIEGLKLAISSHPDLILCDLFMPRMDGYNFLHAIKGQGELVETPVILVTSKASVEEEQNALKAGFIDFIGKPVMPVRVIARIQRALAFVKNRQQPVMGKPISADLQPVAVNTKGSCRSYPQRRETVSRVESKSQRSNQR